MDTTARTELLNVNSKDVVVVVVVVVVAAVVVVVVVVVTCSVNRVHVTSW